MLATDAPLLPHQLQRVAKRAALGIARTGTCAAHGSGEIILAFSTANRLPRTSAKRVQRMDVLSDEHIDPIFRAAIDATEEAIANGLRVFGPRGCDSCTDGYKGRIGVYQVMPVTDEIGRLIMAGGNAHDIADAAKRNNIWDLRRSGLAKVMSGLTSIEEINSVTIE